MLQKTEPHRLVLLRAAEIINERGLAVGVLDDFGGEVCALKALSLAATSKRTLDKACSALARHVYQPGGRMGHREAISRWSDRTADRDSVARTLTHVALC